MEFGHTLTAWMARSQGPVRTITEIILIFVTATLFARLAWLVVAPSESVATYTDRPLPVPMSGAVSTTALSADRTLLLRLNPFDQGDVEAIIEDVPETNLNLSLVGLRMSTAGGQAGNAIIRTPDGVSKNYKVGDSIIAGVTLERILSDRVVINRDGADETLMRVGREAGLAVISDGSQVARPAAARAVAASEPAFDQSVIEARIAAPELLLASIDVRATGGGEGYRLEPRGSAETMRQAGLEPGDILLRVNGTSLDNVDSDELIDRFAAADSLELQVVREGNERTIRLRFGE